MYGDKQETQKYSNPKIIPKDLAHCGNPLNTTFD